MISILSSTAVKIPFLSPDPRLQSRLPLTTASPMPAGSKVKR
jgi:hypothetical protein